jgi:excisionase family DNA binding protein
MRTQSSAEIARGIGLAAATIQKYAREGRIPFHATPGGHRRFDLDEVRSALYGPHNGLSADPLPLDGGLGTGAPITYGPAAATERDTRALVSLPAACEPGARTALQDLFDHARSVLVATRR